MAGRAGISQTQTHSLPLTPTICTLKTTGNAHTNQPISILGWFNALYTHAVLFILSSIAATTITESVDSITYNKYGWPRHEALTAAHSEPLRTSVSLSLC